MTKVCVIQSKDRQRPFEIEADKDEEKNSNINFYLKGKLVKTLPINRLHYYSWKIRP